MEDDTFVKEPTYAETPFPPPVVVRREPEVTPMRQTDIARVQMWTILGVLLIEAFCLALVIIVWKVAP